jgi:MFS family permease
VPHTEADSHRRATATAPDGESRATAPPSGDGPDAPASGLDGDLWRLFAAMVLFAFGWGLFYQLLNVYALSLGAPRFMIGVLTAVYLAAMTLSLIPASWATDRYPLHRVITAIWWLTVPAAIVFALAPSWQWLLLGQALNGAAVGSNPATKVYIILRSPATHVARNMSYVYAGIPVGMILGPLAGGWLATTVGMRWVFVVAGVFFTASSITVSTLGHTPYHAAGRPWSLRDLAENRVFRRHLAFFVCGFFAVYLGQPFVQPYLSQVHGQGYAALGVFAAIGALGGSVTTYVGGRAVHGYGSRPGIAVVLGFMLVGAILLLTGWAPPLWALAVFAFGAFDAFRFVTSGVVSTSFGSVPPTWGYTIFDAVMGVPMVLASLVGGILYQASYRLPFYAVIVMIVALLLALRFASRSRSWIGESGA